MRRLLTVAVWWFMASGSAIVHAGEASGTDGLYLAQAGHAGRFEIEASQMAAQRGSNDYVREFAKRMIADHTRIEAEFKAYASARKLALPAEPDGGQKAILASLGGKTGQSYDREYAQAVGVEAHRSAIRLFEEMSTHATDGQLRDLARKFLPMLKEHEKHAGDLLSKVESGEAQRPRQEGGNPGRGIPHPLPPDRAAPPVTRPTGEPERGTAQPSR
ncbi:DUF4142 domain-containing protein [Pigmentiphaga sp. NML080357]|uniref:DUF4142 domain-containing protein n=1 Tax=Pigmentiphaga sp. NML080357 TaxID=2008675 RepID=UPI001303BAA5|nr:DUF4142 domain-containing protein [Pigmentiphaga sp. NML080357]